MHLVKKRLIDGIELEGLEVMILNEKNDLLLKLDIDVPLQVRTINDKELFEAFIEKVSNLVLEGNLSISNVNKLLPESGTYAHKFIGEVEYSSDAAVQMAYESGYKKGFTGKGAENEVILTITPDNVDMARAIRIGKRHGSSDKTTKEKSEAAKDQDPNVTLSKDQMIIEQKKGIYKYEIYTRSEDGEWTKTESDTPKSNDTEDNKPKSSIEYGGG